MCILVGSLEGESSETTIQQNVLVISCESFSMCKINVSSPLELDYLSEGTLYHLNNNEREE